MATAFALDSSSPDALDCSRRHRPHVTAVVLTNVGFLGLGSVLKYPDILRESADEILAEGAFRRKVRAWRPGTR
jgi:hypothetical protein